jgi:hypothetical protein
VSVLHCHIVLSCTRKIVMSYWPYFAHFEADERHTKSMDTWHNLTRERFGSKAYRDPWPGTWHHQPSIVFEKQLRLLLSTAQPDSTLLSHSLMNLMNLNTHTDEKHLRILVSNVRGKKRWNKHVLLHFTVFSKGFAGFVLCMVYLCVSHVPLSWIVICSATLGSQVFVLHSV